MSLACPQNPVYRTSAQQKAASRESAKIYRYGSPKLRDLLRDKCRVRMKEARRANYELSRTLSGSFAHKLEILREEISEVEQDIELQEAIYKELIDEVNDWFIEQQEEEESYIISTEDDKDIICPICQKQALHCESLVEKPVQRYKCKCDVSFDFAGDFDLLRSTLRSKIYKHELTCIETMTFFVEPTATGSNVLNAMCDSCDYFITL